MAEKLLSGPLVFWNVLVFQNGHTEGSISFHDKNYDLTLPEKNGYFFITFVLHPFENATQCLYLGSKQAN